MGGVVGKAAWEGATVVAVGSYGVDILSYPRPKDGIDEVPWWAACRASKQCCLNEGGITILSLYNYHYIIEGIKVFSEGVVYFKVCR